MAQDEKESRTILFILAETIDEFCRETGHDAQKNVQGPEGSHATMDWREEISSAILLQHRLGTTGEGNTSNSNQANLSMITVPLPLPSAEGLSEEECVEKGVSQFKKALEACTINKEDRGKFIQFWFPKLMLPIFSGNEIRKLNILKNVCEGNETMHQRFDYTDKLQNVLLQYLVKVSLENELTSSHATTESLDVSSISAFQASVLAKNHMQGGVPNLENTVNTIQLFGSFATGAGAYPSLLRGLVTLLQYNLSELLQTTRELFVFHFIAIWDLKHNNNKDSNKTKEDDKIHMDRLKWTIGIKAEEQVHTFMSHALFLLGRYSGEALYDQYLDFPTEPFLNNKEGDDALLFKLLNNEKPKVNRVNEITENSWLTMMLVLVAVRKEVDTLRRKIDEKTEGDAEDIRDKDTEEKLQSEQDRLFDMLGNSGSDDEDSSPIFSSESDTEDTLSRKRKTDKKVKTKKSADAEEKADELIVSDSDQRNLTQYALSTFCDCAEVYLRRYADHKLHAGAKQTANSLATRPLLWSVLRYKETATEKLLRWTDLKLLSGYPRRDGRKNVDEFFCAQLNWYELCNVYQNLTGMRAPVKDAGKESVHQAGNNVFRAYAYYKERISKLEKELLFNWVPPPLQEAVKQREEEKQANVPPDTRKRSREDGNNILKSQKNMSVLSHVDQFNIYFSQVFFQVFDRRCFSILLPEKQRVLTRNLKSLLDLLATYQKNHASFDDALDQFLLKEQRQWRKESLSTASHRALAPFPTICAILQKDTRLMLSLVHSVFAILERRGSVSEMDDWALEDYLLPSLFILSGPMPHDSDEGDGNETNSFDEYNNSPSLYCTQFSVYALLLSEGLHFPWSVEGVALTWLRYSHLCETVFYRCSRKNANTTQLNSTNKSAPFSPMSQLLVKEVLPLLKRWMREDGGGSFSRRKFGSELCNTLNGIDSTLTENYPTYVQFETIENSRLITSNSELDMHLRSVIPLRFSPLCGVFIVVSVYETLREKLEFMLRELETQRALASEEGAIGYMDRLETFCAPQDLRVFRALVVSVHRSVFGFRQQSAELLRLWFGYLSFLFLYIVPPADAGEAMHLMPPSWQQKNVVVDCFGAKVPSTGWRALQSSEETQSSQSELRVVLGELLADLAVLPLADVTALKDCPFVLPMAYANADETITRWLQQEKSLAVEEMQVLQCTLPQLVLENVCFFCKINTDRNTTRKLSDVPAVTSPVTPVSTRRAEEFSDITESFLGLPGLVAFCHRLEECVIPGTIQSSRVQHLIRCLWEALDAVALRG